MTICSLKSTSLSSTGSNACMMRFASVVSQCSSHDVLPQHGIQPSTSHSHLGSSTAWRSVQSHHTDMLSRITAFSKGVTSRPSSLCCLQTLMAKSSIETLCTR